MLFPMLPFLILALLVSGIGAFLWGLYHVDKEREMAEKAIATLLVRPHDTLNTERA